MSDYTSQHWRLAISFDFGTVKSSISYARIPRGAAVLPDTVNTLGFGDGMEVLSQIAYDSGREDWIWGADLQKSIKSPQNPNGTISEEDVITLPKLCLDESKDESKDVSKKNSKKESKNENVRKRVKAQLKRIGPLLDAKTGQKKVPTYQDVCREFLHRLYCYGVKWIPGFQLMTFEQEDIICISTYPAVWSWETSYDFESIVRDAGFTNMVPISEPEAVAAYYIVKNQRDMISLGANVENIAVSGPQCCSYDVDANIGTAIQALRCH